MVEATIIVPTCNRGPVLARCLASLAAQSCDPRRFEILVVDNGSSNDTASTVNAFGASHPTHDIRYAHEPVPGLLAARHHGASEARADILCFVDDDIVADEQWLESVIASFADATVSLVGGPSIPRFETTPPEWMESLWTTVQHGSFLDSLSLLDFGIERREIPAYFVWGLNFNIRRHALYDLGGFHPDGVPPALARYRGDGEGGLSHKLIERGEKTLYEPAARVDHLIGRERLTVAYFERRRFLQGVSDSYSAIRRAGKPDTIEPRVTDKDAFEPDDVESEGLRARLDRAHAEGFNYHLNETRSDPGLLRWVLRPTYLTDYDYGVPLSRSAGGIPAYLRARGQR